MSSPLGLLCELGIVLLIVVLGPLLAGFWITQYYQRGPHENEG